jgi:hypothetical protein
MFQAGPGYNFAVGQGLDSLTRAANAGGMVAGGNLLRESQTFGQGLADQEFQRWQQALAGREGLYAPLEQQARAGAASGGANAALTGATGAANIYTGTGGRLSDLYSGAGAGIAGLQSGQGKSLAELASRGGLAEADIYGAGGARTANLYSDLAGQELGLLGKLAPAQAGTYGQEAAAQTGGSANLWNLIGGGAKLAAGKFF